MRWWNLNPKLKKCAAYASYLGYSTTKEPIVVASSGRSGSTMLAKTIMSSSFREKLPHLRAPRMVFFPGFKSQDFEGAVYDGGVYKTHLLSGRIPVSCKTVFIFDRPDITYSSFFGCVDRYGKDWARQHLINLESPKSFNEISSGTDFLNFEAQLSSWLSRPSGAVVKFDSLWDVQDELSSYLGIKLNFPPKVQRRSKAVTPKGFEEVFKKLWDQYEAAPSFQVKSLC